MDTLMVVAFFVLAVTLFPFGVGPEPSVLSRIAGGVIWVAALLAALLSLDRLFQMDFDDGTLEQLALSSVPLAAVATAKVIAHWLVSGLPLIVTAPALGILLQLERHAYPALMAALFLGTPILSLVGGVGAALVLGARRTGALLALLVLPLYIPVLIFGVGAVDAALFDLPVRPHLSVLFALLLVAAVLAPWAMAMCVRQAIE
jgi:heme exporter protein B